MPEGYTLSKDGHEMQFAVDHLAHFLLIKHIFPLVLKARSDSFAPRIVSIASHGHWRGPVRFDDLTFANGKEYTLGAAYGNAKSANMLFIKELVKRVEGKGILGFAVHPGCSFATSCGEE